MGILRRRPGTTPDHRQRTAQSLTSSTHASTGTTLAVAVGISRVTDRRRLPGGRHKGNRRRFDIALVLLILNNHFYGSRSPWPVALTVVAPPLLPDRTGLRRGRRREGLGICAVRSVRPTRALHSYLHAIFQICKARPAWFAWQEAWPKAHGEASSQPSSMLRWTSQWLASDLTWSK